MRGNISLLMASATHHLAFKKGRAILEEYHNTSCTAFILLLSFGHFIISTLHQTCKRGCVVEYTKMLTVCDCYCTSTLLYKIFHVSTSSWKSFIYWVDGNLRQILKYSHIALALIKTKNPDQSVCLGCTSHTCHWCILSCKFQKKSQNILTSCDPRRV